MKREVLMVPATQLQVLPGFCPLCSPYRLFSCLSLYLAAPDPVLHVFLVQISDRDWLDFLRSHPKFLGDTMWFGQLALGRDMESASSLLSGRWLGTAVMEGTWPEPLSLTTAACDNVWLVIYTSTPAVAIHMICFIRVISYPSPQICNDSF